MKRVLNSLYLLSLSSLLILTSCSESLVGDSFQPESKIDRCREVVFQDFSLFAPCSWNITDTHPEGQEVGIIYTGLNEVYYTDRNVSSLRELTDPNETYFYPVLDGTIIFLEEMIDGQSVIAVYFEGQEIEGQAVRIKFWYNARFDTEELRNFILSIQLS